ncbi:unnamed protein product, partial [Meganyctiphanes norvegica]
NWSNIKSLPKCDKLFCFSSVPPLDVKILGYKSSVNTGESYTITCESHGSRPPADLTWWRNEEQLSITDYKVVKQSERSSSHLTLKVSRRDNSAVIACHAVNHKLPASPVEDSHLLNILYPPEAQLRVGHNMNLSNIKEGDDVYFECQVDANPKVTNVNFFKNGVLFSHDLASGIIKSNQSLVLQHVSRTSSGNYSCEASNIMGTDTSNTRHLNVMFKPVCAPGQKHIYGSGRYKATNITCQVESYPEATVFRWAFNTSVKLFDIPEEKTTTGVGHSLVLHTPHSQQDFGSLLCWAVNDVGKQIEPCIFRVVPATVPDPVQNCSIFHNASAMGVLVVHCDPGWNGGLPQRFTLEVNRLLEGQLVESLIEDGEPEFIVTGLAPGTDYTIVVGAVNSQGSSDLKIMQFITPIDVAEKQTSPGLTPEDAMFSWTPIFGVLLGVAFSLIVCFIAMIVLVRSKGTTRTHMNSTTTDLQEREKLNKQESEHSNSNKSISDPDIILFKDEAVAKSFHQSPSSTLKIKKQSIRTASCSLTDKDKTIIKVNHEVPIVVLQQKLQSITN